MKYTSSTCDGRRHLFARYMQYISGPLAAAAVLLGLGSLLAAAPAHAQEAPAVREATDFERYLAAAVRLYENLEYERALEQLERAKRFSRGADDDVLLALYEGVVRADLGEAETARAAFKTGLLLDPEAKLPVKVSPKVAREFEAMRAEAKRELAPLIARREAEHRQREAAAKADEAKREREAAARTEADRRAREEAARAGSQAPATSPSKPGDADHRSPNGGRDERIAVAPDRPERSRLTDPGPSSDALGPSLRDTPPRRKPAVVPWVFGGLAVAAGGAGGYFGMQSRDSVDAARGAAGQRETADHLGRAQVQARNANILFAAAGTAAVGALISALVATADAP